MLEKLSGKEAIDNRSIIAGVIDEVEKACKKYNCKNPDTSVAYKDKQGNIAVMFKTGEKGVEFVVTSVEGNYEVLILSDQYPLCDSVDDLINLIAPELS